MLIDIGPQQKTPDHGACELKTNPSVDAEGGNKRVALLGARLFQRRALVTQGQGSVKLEGKYY